ERCRLCINVEGERGRCLITLWPSELHGISPYRLTRRAIGAQTTCDELARRAPSGIEVPHVGVQRDHRIPPLLLLAWDRLPNRGGELAAHLGFVDIRELPTGQHVFSRDYYVGDDIGCR